MLKKRLVGVITVKDGRAVQSFSYSRHLPLGSVECLAENLDRWGADEILILCIDRSRRGLGPDFDLIQRVGALGLSTPITYGGGIRNSQDAGRIIQLGADRLCMDALFRDGTEQQIRAIAELVGAQAVIATMPLSFDECVQGGALKLLDYRTRESSPVPTGLLDFFLEGLISEALVIDWRHEGAPKSFDSRLVEHFPLAEVPLIVFGGISSPQQMDLLFGKANVVAIGVGNFLSYSEHAIQHLRRKVHGSCLRSGDFISSDIS